MPHKFIPDRDLDDPVSPADHQLGGVTPLERVSEKEAKKNRRKARKWRTGFCR